MAEKDGEELRSATDATASVPSAVNAGKTFGVTARPTVRAPSALNAAAAYWSVRRTNANTPDALNPGVAGMTLLLATLNWAVASMIGPTIVRTLDDVDSTPDAISATAGVAVNAVPTVSTPDADRLAVDIRPGAPTTVNVPVLDSVAVPDAVELPSTPVAANVPDVDKATEVTGAGVPVTDSVPATDRAGVPAVSTVTPRLSTPVAVNPGRVDAVAAFCAVDSTASPTSDSTITSAGLPTTDSVPELVRLTMTANAGAPSSGPPYTPSPYTPSP